VGETVVDGGVPRPDVPREGLVSSRDGGCKGRYGSSCVGAAGRAKMGGSL
jgi:hypothetical protein